MVFLYFPVFKSFMGRPYELCRLKYCNSAVNCSVPATEKEQYCFFLVCMYFLAVIVCFIAWANFTVAVWPLTIVIFKPYLLKQTIFGNRSIHILWPGFMLAYVCWNVTLGYSVGSICASHKLHGRCIHFKCKCSQSLGYNMKWEHLLCLPNSCKDCTNASSTSTEGDLKTLSLPFGDIWSVVAMVTEEKCLRQFESSRMETENKIE